MATDAQGRLLSDDGYYYWDGKEWQLVEQGQTSAGADTTTQTQQPEQKAPTAEDLLAAMNVVENNSIGALPA